ncbi:MAG TPA: molybdopterin-dependent oxidoreductase, partial [Terriglobales bacterium]|nr:molybdopterin-dependent oxidoreductase [Terriglobales bacterium]
MDSWLSRVIPSGLGPATPHPYRELATVLWQNKTQLPYAWKILTRGVCNACSLGPYGLRDDALSGIHLCMTRLKLLRLNTMGPFGKSLLAQVRQLDQFDEAQLSSLGRLPYPMIRRRQAEGFSRLPWDEALELACKAIHDSSPQEMGFVATAQGLTNEVYYTLQKLARTLGTNNVDLCSESGPAPSLDGLKETLGLAAPSCSLSDFIGTDLLVIFGSEFIRNQPVTTKYLHYAKKQGTRIFIVDPMPESGLNPYGMTSPSWSHLLDDFFQVRLGGDVAFTNGVLKALIAFNRTNPEFIADHTNGFEALKMRLQEQPWDM